MMPASDPKLNRLTRAMARAARHHRWRGSSALYPWRLVALAVVRVARRGQFPRTDFVLATQVCK